MIDFGPLHVGPVELAWVLINGAALILTVLALIDARADARTVRALNGRAREIVTAGNVRREGLRVVAQILLLTLGVPALLSERNVGLSPFVLQLIALALVMLLSTALDARDRTLLTGTVVNGRRRHDDT